MRTSEFFNIKKVLQIFGSSLSPADIERQVGIHLPAFSKNSEGRKLKSWSNQELVLVGEQIGFLKKPAKPQAVSVFVTKGGVLKTALTLNIARMAALHNIKTCVVGLDMQSDISEILGGGELASDDESFDLALEKANRTKGLAQLFDGSEKLESLLRPTDLPCLKFIPETPELVALDQALFSKNRREYWLEENVIAPLKKDFDLILLDCSPNWNRLITNALMASDVLISPVECKINNFRNLRVFRALVSEFQKEMRKNLKHIFIPTKYSPSRKLSSEIFNWYLENLPNCIQAGIKESITGEEACALHLSTPEFQGGSEAATEMRIILQSIFKNFALEKSKLMDSASLGGA